MKASIRSNLQNFGEPLNDWLDGPKSYSNYICGTRKTLEKIDQNFSLIVADQKTTDDRA